MATTLLAATAACSGGDGDASGSPDGEAVTGTASAWTTVGGDLANTRAVADAGIAADDAGQLAPAWQIDGLKGVTGTPVVADGTVYVGDWTSHVRALDAATGHERWSHDLGGGYVGGALAVADDHAYVGTFDARIVALDRTSGEPAWETDLDAHPKAVVFGSPVTADGLVVAGVGSYEVFVPGDPPTFRGSVVALDAATGAEAWRFAVTDEAAGEGAGVSVWSSPAIDLDRGALYIGTGQAYSQPAPARSDSLLALDLATGRELWHTQFTAGDAWSIADTTGRDADVGGVPNLFTVDGVDAVGVGDKAGTYRALDRATGDVLWESPITPGGLQGGVMASAAVADGTVFVGSNDESQDADLVALDADTGAELWRVGVEAHVTGPVTWADGVLYLADDSGRIAAYDAGDGTRLWEHATAFPAAGGTSVVDGTVYAGWGWWLAGWTTRMAGSSPSAWAAATRRMPARRATAPTRPTTAAGSPAPATRPAAPTVVPSTSSTARRATEATAAGRAGPRWRGWPTASTSTSTPRSCATVVARCRGGDGTLVSRKADLPRIRQPDSPLAASSSSPQLRLGLRPASLPATNLTWRFHHRINLPGHEVGAVGDDHVVAPNPHDGGRVGEVQAAGEDPRPGPADLGVELEHTPTGRRRTDWCAGLFCFIGAEPATEWLEGARRPRRQGLRADRPRPPRGHRRGARVRARPPLLFVTSVPGVFAVGDVRSGSLKRVAAAVGEGSSALRSVYDHLSQV